MDLIEKLKFFFNGHISETIDEMQWANYGQHFLTTLYAKQIIIKYKVPSYYMKWVKTSWKGNCYAIIDGTLLAYWTTLLDHLVPTLREERRYKISYLRGRNRYNLKT